MKLFQGYIDASTILRDHQTIPTDTRTDHPKVCLIGLHTDH